MRFDTRGNYAHPRFVRVMRPLASVLVLVAILASQVSVFCAGWQTSAEARMACCVEGVDCGMHEPAPSTDAKGSRAQDAADQCCAASESDDSKAPKSTTSIQSPAMALRLSMELMSLETSSTHAWHAQPAFSPPRHVSTHVLFSVFLV